MRDFLIGYLLGALEPHEHRQVRQRLEADPSLRRDARLLKIAMEPLEAAPELDTPPAELAARTVRAVVELSGTHHPGCAMNLHNSP